MVQNYNQNYNHKINIFIFILFLISLAIIFVILSTTVREKFFSLSCALYSPKRIPESDTCPCTQLLGSSELIAKEKIAINKCESCHLN